MAYIIGGSPGVSHAEANKKGIDSKVYTLEDFVHQAEIDHLNMFILVDFIKNSKICQKVTYTNLSNNILIFTIVFFF